MVNRDTKSAWSYHIGMEHTDGRLMNVHYTYGLISSSLLVKLYKEPGPIPLPRDALFATVPALPAIAGDGDIPEISIVARILPFSAGITKTF